MKRFIGFDMDNAYDTRIVQLVYYSNISRVDTLINVDKYKYIINEKYIFEIDDKKVNNFNNYHNLLNFCNK